MFNKFDVIWLLTKGGPLNQTETLPTLAYRRAFVEFDLGAGAAVATKFTAIPVLGSVTLTWLAAKFLLLRRSSSDGERLPPFSWTRITGQLLLIASICLAVLVFSYLRSAGEGWRLFTLGLEIVRKHNKEGHLAYFLGELRGGGWWYFYPVVLAVKTPIPLFCSTFLGSVWVVIRNRRSASFSEFSPLLAILSVLLFFCAFNRINIGARHVMILFPLMAIVSSPLLMHYLRSRTGFLERGFSSGVLLLQLAIVIQAHPDYLAYCNLIAGEHPERIINDSDLDWGQDLRRLEAELRRRDIREINLIYRGSADLSREDLPRFHLISPSDRPSGWLAVSLLAKATGDPKHGYSWLNQYQPVVRIGKSIDLYNIPATPSP